MREIYISVEFDSKELSLPGLTNLPFELSKDTT